MTEDNRGSKRARRSETVRWQDFDRGMFRAYGYSNPAGVELVRGTRLLIPGPDGGVDSDEDWLIERSHPGEASDIYEPLRDFAVLAHFDRLAYNPTTEGIAEFASRFGWLEGGQMVAKRPGGPIRRGEPVLQWLKELKAFWVTQQVAKALGAADRHRPEHLEIQQTRSEALSWMHSVVQWSPDESSVRVFIPGAPPYPSRSPYGFPAWSEWITTPTHRPNLRQHFDRSRPSEVLRFFVHTRIQAKCESMFSLVPFWTPGEPTASELRVMPVNLLGVIYLQLATTWFKESKTVQECGAKDCPNGGRFVPARRGARYCSDACRYKASKERQRQQAR